jgi:hypothetical protein
MKAPRLGSAVAVAMIAAAVVGISTAAHATGKTTLDSDEALGLGDNGTTLRIFELDDPDDDDLITEVTGLADQDSRQLEDHLIGIDYRVEDDTFYGVGNLGGVYTLNTRTGAATLVSTMTIAPEGEHFGMDFDAREDDRFQIISDTEQNLVHFLDGDTTEAYGHTRGETGLAFTNNHGASDTDSSVFSIHAGLKFVLQIPDRQSPVNVAGMGPLRGPTSISKIVGFDIQSKVSSGLTVANTGYASLRTTDTARPSLYKVDLLSGKATKVGSFDKQVADIAVKQP